MLGIIFVLGTKSPPQHVISGGLILSTRFIPSIKTDEKPGLIEIKNTHTYSVSNGSKLNYPKLFPHFIKRGNFFLRNHNLKADE